MALVLGHDNEFILFSRRPWPLLWATLAVIASIKVILIGVVLPVAVKAGWAPYAAFSDHYHAIAQNLLDGYGYRVTPDTAETMVRAPGNVLFLAGIFALFGKSLTAVKAANVVLGLITSGLVFLLTLKITRNTLLSSIACVVFSLHPAVLTVESRAGVESLFMFCLALFSLFFYRALETDTYKGFLLAGLALGLTMSVRTSPVLIVGAFFLYLMHIHRHSAPLKEATTKTGVLVIAMLIVLSPWMLRNYLISGVPTFSESMLGAGAFQGYYVTNTMGDGRPYGDRIQEAARQQSLVARNRGVRFVDNGYWDFFYSIEDELSYNKTLFTYTVDIYKDDPLLFLKHCALNSLRFWFQGKTPLITLLGVIVTLPILVLAAVGTYIAVRREYVVGPLWLIIVSIYAVHIPLIAHSRYYTPLVPFLSVLVSVGLSHRKLLGRWVGFGNESWLR